MAKIEKKTKVTLKDVLGNDCEKLSPDTHKLQDALKNIYPTLTDVLEQFMGDKYKLALGLTEQKLGAQASVEQYKKTYKLQLDNINRYLKGTRTPSKQVI